MRHDSEIWVNAPFVQDVPLGVIPGCNAIHTCSVDSTLFHCLCGGLECNCPPKRVPMIVLPASLGNWALGECETGRCKFLPRNAGHEKDRQAGMNSKKEAPQTLSLASK